MKLIIIVLLSTTIVHATEKAQTFIPGESYEIVGKIKSQDSNRLIIHVLDETTSTFHFNLLDKSEHKKFSDGLIIRACVQVTKECVWDCKGSMRKFIGLVAPWKVPEGMDAIKAVNSCE